jgi:hypothetical protein
LGPLQEVATRKDLPINKEEQQKENIEENNERSIGKQKIDERDWFVWIEGKIGDVSPFSMTTKEENNRIGDSGSIPTI